MDWSGGLYRVVPSMIQMLKSWWAKSTGFRHAVTAWLSLQIVAPLGQVIAWGKSCTTGVCDSSLLPSLKTELIVIMGGAVVALGSGLLKVIQQKRAFPKVGDN